MSSDGFARDEWSSSARRSLWGLDDDDYGNVLFARATGELPEMESSKAAASRLARHARADDHVLDVACGAGHYLRTLRRTIGTSLRYTGLDGASRYARLGSEAFAADGGASFVVGDASRLPFPARSFDVVMCNNALLHLPTIEDAMAEMLRVARRFVVVRTLVGERSFRIQDVLLQDDEFVGGHPRSFHWYNIYSSRYVEELVRRNERVETVTIEADRDFDPERIASNQDEQGGAPDATQLLDGWQVNGYVLLPWTFVEVELRPN